MKVQTTLVKKSLGTNGFIPSPCVLELFLMVTRGRLFLHPTSLPLVAVRIYGKLIDGPLSSLKFGSKILQGKELAFWLVLIYINAFMPGVFTRKVLSGPSILSKNTLE